jgi:hypothetical protein
MFQRIITELRHHIPFTIFGAATGVVAMIIIVAVGALSPVSGASETVFYVLHPLHVVLSAGVTTAMYRKHTRGRIILAILIGYFGSIGIATLSDSVVPYIGELLLDLPHAEAHIGFIEEWHIVNPAAFLGIAIGLWGSNTKFPHAGHVLISTWASLFHTIMAFGETVEWIQLLPIFVYLFLAVWLPCCLSDIVFPLLFTKGNVPLEEE